MVIPKLSSGYSKSGRWVFAQAPNYTGYSLNNDAPTTLPLSTERFNSLGCSLSSYQLTGLTAGEYYCKLFASVMSNSANATYGFIYLWDLTNSGVLVSGATKSAGGNQPCTLEGSFNLAGTISLEFRSLLFTAATSDPSVRRRYNTEGPSNTTAGLDELITLELYKK